MLAKDMESTEEQKQCGADEMTFIRAPPPTDRKLASGHLLFDCIHIYFIFIYLYLFITNILWLSK